MKAPERLLDDPVMSHRLKVDLARVRDNSPVHYDVSTGAAVFRSTLEKAATAGRVEGTSSTAPILGKPFVLKLITFGLVATGLYYYLLGQKTETISVPLPPTKAQEAPEIKVASPTLPAIPSGTSLVPPPHQEQTQLEAPAPAIARSASPKVVPTMLDEVAQLKQVRLASKSNSQEAVRLAKEGHRRFPGGLLHEEREGLLILSLQNLNRMDEARQRATLFKARYPKSALLPQISSSPHQALP